MKHDFSLKRESTNLPSEQLYKILCKIYPKELADKLYTNLTRLEPTKEEV